MTRALITASRLGAFRRCQRFHDIRYRLGVRPAQEDQALVFGTAAHRGLEAWWRSWMVAAAAVIFDLLTIRYPEETLLPLAPALDDMDPVLVGLHPEHTAGGTDWTDPLRAALVAVRLWPLADPFEQAKLEEMLIGYHRQWIAEEFEVVAVERRFETDLLNPDTGATSRSFSQAGVIDVLLRRDGEDVIMEHKTSSEDISPGSGYWQRRRMDPQVSIYFAGGQALGAPPVACVYDVLGKPRLQPLRATPEEERKYTKEKTKKCPSCNALSYRVPADENDPSRIPCIDCGGKREIVIEPARLYANQRDSDETVDEFRARVRAALEGEPDRYFVRQEIVRIGDELVEHARDVWALARQIREGELAQRAPRNPDACHLYGKTCPYYSACCGETSLDDPAYFVREDDVHPELSRATE